jgi:hypothetical protein
MALQALHRDAVFAGVGGATEPAAASTATGIDDTAMDRAERGCGERREHERMRGNISRDTSLFAPGQPGGNEEVGVTAIAFRAGRTTRLASIATGNEHEAGSFGSRRPPSQDCSGPSRDGDRLTLQADRRCASSRPPDQLDDVRRAGAVEAREHSERLDE